MIRKRLMTEINLAAMNMKDNFQSNFYSDDFQGILISTLEQKYGGTYTSHRAAKIIQQAFRQFRLKQKLNASPFYEIKSFHYRNYSMPDNLHYFNKNDEEHSSDECLNNFSKGYSAMRSLKSSKIKDSLSLLLPELQVSSMIQSSLSESSNTEKDNGIQEDKCQFKVGDILSTKCEEDLERFQNDSFKTDSTEDSDSASDKVDSYFQDPSVVVKLPPPMPVILTSILSNKSDKLKTKMKLFSFDKSPTKGEFLKSDQENIIQKPAIPPRSGICSMVGLQSTRSPRDSGVSSHSSNTDLLTIEYSGQILDNSRSHISNCFYSQKPQSVINAGVAKSIAMVNQSPAQKDVIFEHESVIENYIPSITEDNDSLFDSSGPPIPSIMTSSKDSGVDADSSCGITNPTGHLRRLSFQDKHMHWKLFQRHSCFTGCIPQPTNVVVNKEKAINSPVSSSPWLKPSNVDVDNLNTTKIPDLEYKELINRVLYRVAVNLFNRNTAVGLKFMEDHQIFNVRCPIEIANFLRSREVNLQVLAEFISSRNSVFHLQVLRSYLQNMSLQNLSFLEAFDMFISSFKLPEDSARLNFLIAEFCQYYTRQIQKCTGVDLGALMGLSRIIVLLRSSVIRSRLISSNNSVLSFSDFVKNVQNCFKGQHVPYNMEMLQKIYISITRSNTDNVDLAENLINRIGNIDECKSKSGTPSKSGKITLCSNYLQQTFRRLTYCCDVQQSDLLGKKVKKNEHLRSIFVFNDTVIVAKRLSKLSSKHSKLFRTDSRFQCKDIVNLLNNRVTSVTCPGAPYQISISPQEDSSKTDNIPHNSFYLICDSEASRDKLISKINMSQMESQCVEQLRLQQWNCVHDYNECLCLSIIKSRLPRLITLKKGD